MNKSSVGVFVSACLAGSLGLALPANADNVSARAATTGCSIMGLSVKSLRPYFGSTVVVEAVGGDECGITGDLSVTVYLYPANNRAIWMKSYGGAFLHAKRLGGLGAGASHAGGSGAYWLNLTSGTHFVAIDAQSIPSTGKLIALAHIIYRALA